MARHSAGSIVTSILCITLLSVAFGFQTAVADSEYPLRPYYPEVPFIDTITLQENYESILVVDIRSSFEYDVARINKAILLPLTDKDFALKLESLRPKESGTRMVFYCNGHTCAKSYQAAQLALSLGFKNVLVYDGGIFDWIMAAPEQATLMGETPARAGRIITQAQFEEQLIDYDDFSEQAMDKDTIVIDIRDPFQRDMRPRIPGIRNIPLDPLLDLVTSRIWTEKRLLFFDAVGKQIRWLQYFLESYGYFDYAFLKGGVRGISGDSGKVEPVIEANRSIIASQEMLLTLTAETRLDNSDRKVLSYLLANVKFNNYVVVDIAKASKKLGMSKTLILNSVKKLSRLDYTIHSVLQDTLIVQVDPRLAWKGTVGGKQWKDSMEEFEKKGGE